MRWLLLSFCKSRVRILELAGVTAYTCDSQIQQMDG